MRPERAGLTGPQGFLRALDLSEVPEEDELKARLEEIRRPKVERLHRFAEAGGEVHEGEPPTLILPIDQGEELFGGGNAESVEALELLRAVISADENLLVILTVRADSFSLLNEQRGLEALARKAFIPWLVTVDDTEGPSRRRVARMMELP